MNASVRVLAVVAASFVFTSSLEAQDFDIRDFHRLSDAEILTPAFTSAGGETTELSYTGFVEMVVSGMGSRLPGQLVDRPIQRIPWRGEHDDRTASSLASGAGSM